jgi:hypothetical protein
MLVLLTIVMNVAAVLLWLYTIFVDLGRTPLLLFIQASIIMFQIALALSFETELHEKFGEGWGEMFRPDTRLKGMLLGMIFFLYLGEIAFMVILGQSTPPDLMSAFTLAILIIFLTLVFRRAFAAEKEKRRKKEDDRMIA